MPLTETTLNSADAMGAISTAVALVFGYAALAKLFGIRAFVAGIRDYRIVPGRMAPVVAGVLILSESGIAVTHFARISLSLAVPATTVVLSVFLIMTALDKVRGTKRPCLCFGANGEDAIDNFALLRICLLLSAELTLYSYLLFNDGAIAAANSSIASISAAALAVMLTTWGLAAAEFRAAWIAVRSRT